MALHVYLVGERHTDIPVHEQLLVINVLLHSSIHELESIQQARQLANGIYRNLHASLDFKG